MDSAAQRSSIRFEWSPESSGERYRTGVSLHGHTLHSRESLDCLYSVAGKSSLLLSALRAGERAYRNTHGVELDLTRGWWTPPLGAFEAWSVESAQMEARGRNALVSLTDHDDIEAPVSLQIREKSRGTPISLEWTVPLEGTFLHLGIHNLPPAKARMLFADMQEYRFNPHPARLEEILAALATNPEVLVVLNHPLWDEKGIGQGAHEEAVTTLLRECGAHLHALELNGLRPWSENKRVPELSSAWRKPVISGGDRHIYEPNALINLTNAAEFASFVQEVREGWSRVLFLHHYRESHALRIIQNTLDFFRHYEQHVNGWASWSDRVFFTCEDGVVRSISEIFGPATPRPIRVFVHATRVASAPPVRRLMREFFSVAERGRLPDATAMISE